MTSNSREPLISMIMPVFNGGAYLVASVASIIEQTHRDWELIAIDDGSTDGSSEVLDWFARQDARIRVVHQANAGIVAALNRGASLARGPLLGRMDDDDIALPHRLASQADFLRKHPACTVVGGSILEMDAEGDPLAISRLPLAHADIVDALLHRRTGHFHPTTMFRAEAFEAAGGYRDRYQWVEDHDLWLRMAQRGRLANLDDVLLCYRQHARSICWQRSAQQRELMNELMGEAYRTRGLEVPPQVVASTSLTRSAAGPGKWARAAAKGGYPRSVFKHLSALLRSDSSRAYKARMVLEALMRLTLGCARRQMRGGRLSMPAFPEWQARLAHDLPGAISLSRAA